MHHQLKNQLQLMPDRSFATYIQPQTPHQSSHHETGKKDIAKDTSNLYHHQHLNHHQYPLASTSSIFPSSSLRDIVSLIFILLSLPQSISLGLLILHIVLGSNFIGGKFIIQFLLRDKNDIAFSTVKRWCINFCKIVIVNSGVFYILNYFIHKKSYFNYIIILLKAFISSDLLGSSSINNINTISNKKLTTKIQYDDNRRFLNNNLINSIICFITINYINYLISWLNFNMLDISNLNYINNNNLIRPCNKLYLILSFHIISSSIFKKSQIIHNTIPNTFDDISINCDKNKLLDVDLNDDIMNSSPYFKNTKHIRASKSIAIKNFENFIVSPFNSKLTILKNKLRINASQITSSPAVASDNVATTSTTTTSISTSTSTSLTTTTVSPHITTIENTIIIQPFWSIFAASKAILKNPNLFTGELTRCKNYGGEFLNLFLYKSNVTYSSIKMATMLIDDSKVIFKFLDPQEVAFLNLSAMIVKLNNVNWSYFKIVTNQDLKNDDTDELETYLIIYGLTSLFQYEIDLIHEPNHIVNHFIINTTNNKESVVLNQSLPETSSLTTLQISLLSTMKNLESLRAKFKKFKKDENKKLTETKNNIDNLKNKISKYNNKQVNDQRVFGKMQGLKHSVIQLETEIESLSSTIDELTLEEEALKHSLNNKEAGLVAEIREQELIMLEYEERMKNERANLKSVKSEHQTTELKHQKLVNKQQARHEEIRTLHTELKNIKKVDILSKFSKRIKRTNERFDTILPKVAYETEVLRQDCSEILNE